MKLNWFPVNFYFDMKLIENQNEWFERSACICVGVKKKQQQKYEIFNWNCFWARLPICQSYIFIYNVWYNHPPRQICACIWVCRVKYLAKWCIDCLLWLLFRISYRFSVRALSFSFLSFWFLFFHLAYKQHIVHFLYDCFGLCFLCFCFCAIYVFNMNRIGKSVFFIYLFIFDRILVKIAER